jgi:branched-chain amino acid transport system substrate-binding protein
MFADSFYWDLNDKTCAWSKRFMERFNGKAPGSLQAAVYGAVLHYLKAVDAAKSDDGAVVAEQMRKMPINDFYTIDGTIRDDGRVLRDMCLWQVKDPSDSKYPWDYYKLIAAVTGENAFRRLADGGCPLVFKK